MPSSGPTRSGSPCSADAVPSRDGHGEGRCGAGGVRTHGPAGVRGQGGPPHRRGGRAGRPDRRVPRGVHPGDPDLDRLTADLGRRRAVVRHAGRPGRRRARPGDRRAGGRRPRDRYLRGDRGRGARGPRIDDLQHHAVPRAGRGAARQAPQADADRVGAHGLGDGRRVDPAGGRHPPWPAERADLLGELHAAGAVLPLLPGRRHLDRADAGTGGRVDREHASHRPGGSVLRHRGQPVPPSRPDPGRLPATGRGLATSSPTTTSGSRPATP